MATVRGVVQQKLAMFATHMALSLAVIMLMALIIKTLWYPDFLFEIDGGIQGLQIVFWVDVVLGPVLTFAVYKKGKKGLLLDLTLIVTAQIACLFWGVYQTYQERPLVIALAEDTFHTMSASALDFHEIPLEAIDKLPGDYPKRVYVTKEQTDGLTAEEKLRHHFQNGPLYVQHKSYHPLSSGSEYIKKYGVSSRYKVAALKKQAVVATEDSNDNNITSGLFFLFEGKFKQGTVEVDPKTGEFLSFELL